MARCEDFPCCGHEAGDCPDAQGRMKCIGCHRRVPRTRPNSWCSDKCQRADLRRRAVQEDMGHGEMDY